MSSSSASALGVNAQARTNALAGVVRSTLDFWTLTKPEINFLIVMAAFTGFCRLRTTASSELHVRQCRGRIDVCR
jgi:hypothetical protein